MVLVTIIKPDFFHEDDRGTLTQLVRKGYSQVNVIRSTKGAFRGGHYHKHNAEAFYIISGSLELTLSRGEEGEKHVFKSGDFFRLEPFVVHSFLFCEDTVLVSMYDVGVELTDKTKDIIPE